MRAETKNGQSVFFRLDLLTSGEGEKFQHVICNQWRLKSKAEDCGIWCLALTWEGSGCIYSDFGSVLVLYQSSCYSINSIIFHYDI